ncbi:unnamed protein product [Lepidochelys olivacea]
MPMKELRVVSQAGAATTSRPCTIFGYITAPPAAAFKGCRVKITSKITRSSEFVDYGSDPQPIKLTEIDGDWSYTDLQLWRLWPNVVLAKLVNNTVYFFKLSAPQPVPPFTHTHTLLSVSEFFSRGLERKGLPHFPKNRYRRSSLHTS